MENKATQQAIFDLKMFKDIVTNMESILIMRDSINSSILSAQEEGKALDVKIFDTEQFSLNTIEAIS